MKDAQLVYSAIHFVGRSRLARLALIAVVVAGATALGGMADPEVAQANHYNCDDANGCYGTIAWNGGMDGAQAKIRVGTMSMAGTNPDYHINNALWVRDRVVSSSSDCTWRGFGTLSAWVEVGYQAEGGNQWPQFYYWVDCRINASYYEEAIGPVNAVDRNKDNLFRIVRFGYGSTQWYVLIDTVSGTDYSRLSYTNPMSADYIEIGGEASGKHGGYSAPAYYKESQWIWILANGNWQYTYQETYVDDGITGQGVDYAQFGRWQSYWSVYPSPGGTGGSWRTYFPS